MDNNFDTGILQICRTCLKEITDASFLYLDCIPAANTQLTIRQKLYSCIPELDLSIVSDPVICSKCVDYLLSVFEFKKNCLQSEIQINKYIQQVQHSGDLTLVEVIRYHQPSIENVDIKIKMEDLEITKNFKNEYLVCDVSTFNEASTFTESKYLLEPEKVKTEEVLFNTLDDYNINYNLLAVQENSDTHTGSIALNCSPEEVLEHQNNYSKNLNKTHAYYQCHKCVHKAESKLKLILHLEHHKRKNFYHEEILSRRLPRYHKNLNCYYKCSLCNYLTKYKCVFDFHVRIHLVKKNYKHIFKPTNVHTKTFRTFIKINKTNIKDNKRKYDKYYERSLQVQSKSKKSKQKLSHRNNLKPNMRADIVDKLFKCSICEYQCNFKGSLKQHMQLHTGEKPFSCSVCGYQCSQKNNLKQHMQTHTREKPFPCSVCGYRCSRKSSLKQHILIHTGEKPFSCSICKFQCSSKSDLKKHVLVHTGEKPFSCSVCKYQCRLNSLLKRHMRTHTGEKPFSCSVCEYRCNDKSNLQKHTYRIHTPSRVQFANTSVAGKVT